MTSQLIPCAACRRHVRSHETTCPFCDTAIVATNGTTREPSTRLGRAAMFAFRATTVAALSTLPGCSGGGGQVYGGPPITEAPPSTGTGPIVPSSIPVPPSTTMMQPYGAPPITEPPPPPPTTDAPPDVPPEAESHAEPHHRHHEASVHALYGAAAPAYGATPEDLPEELRRERFGQ